LLDEIPDLTDDGPLRFSSFAEVVGAHEVSEAEELAAIDPHHMWTSEYAESRFRWRPKKPLTVLVLRTYLLPEAIELPYVDEYGGCKSWIELKETVSVDGTRPALTEEDFDKLLAPALGVLRRLDPAPAGA
jgi:hypothetical protein